MDLAGRLERCYSGAIFDVLREAGLPDQALPHGIRPLDPTWRLAGPAFPVSGRRTTEFGVHETILEWTTFLSKAPSGSVVVSQPNDLSLAHMGELSSETLQHRGVRGCVIDGGCRDTPMILKMGFPVFCRYTTPADIAGRWVIDRLGEPIRIGSVSIRAGDYVMADLDGVVVIPQAVVGEIVGKTEEVMQRENLVRKAILEGADPREAYLKYGKF
ncbi:MAG TPA: RraA family protein [Planctomycetota bacterium]|nr:RraA family protein [Planctomycetota bacterium]